MHRFFVPNATECNDLYLSEEESKHAIRVLRLSVGDQVELMDGKGGFFLADVIAPHPKRCFLKIVESKYEERDNYYCHIAISPTKNNDRFEWFLEKSTEIGIHKITPIITSNSERSSIKYDRAKKVIISAAKQSGSAYLPELTPLIKYKDFINSVAEDQKFIAHCSESKVKNELSVSIEKSKSIIVLIGPEGDFTEGEVENAVEIGFTPVSLGKNRLRTETAGIVACHTARIINEGKLIGL